MIEQIRDRPLRSLGIAVAALGGVVGSALTMEGCLEFATSHYDAYYASEPAEARESLSDTNEGETELTIGLLIGGVSLGGYYAVKELSRSSKGD